MRVKIFLDKINNHKILTEQGNPVCLYENIIDLLILLFSMFSIIILLICVAIIEIINSIIFWICYVIRTVLFLIFKIFTNVSIRSFFYIKRTLSKSQ